MPIALPRSIRVTKNQDQRLFSLVGTGCRRGLGNQEEEESKIEEMDDEEFQREVANCRYSRGIELLFRRLFAWSMDWIFM